MYMLVLVLQDETKLVDLLDAWREAGATGATVLFSTGMGGLITKKSMLRDDIPLFPSIEDLLLEHKEIQNRTIFAIVDSLERADALVEVTEGVIGPLSEPFTGIAAVYPLSRVYGGRWN